MKDGPVEHSFTVEEISLSGSSRLRFDQALFEYLSTNIPEKFSSRSQAKKLITAGNVSINNKITTKPGVELQPGDRIKLLNFEINAEALELEGYDYPLKVVFEDENLIVVDKPAGLTMHPGAGNRSKTLLNALLFHYPELREQDRAGIVHRLDKDTTGLVVVARDPLCHHKLAEQFQARTILRRYVALCFSTPRGKRLIDREDSGIIETLIVRDARDKTRMAVDRDRGRRAVTNWQVKRRFSCGVLVELKLETGRTHQIRVHLSHIGSPIIGDQQYRAPDSLPGPLSIAAAEFGRQALHAFKLGFVHPASGKTLTFEAPLPDDMSELISLFESYTG